jgi:hypothetical protein
VLLYVSQNGFDERFILFDDLFRPYIWDRILTGSDVARSLQMRQIGITEDRELKCTLLE